MSDPTSPDQSGPRMSEEQAREYASKLRSTPAEQVVVQVLSSLLSTAQVKLGRRDARLFIDLSAIMLEHTRKYVPADLTKQVEQALGQLRFGQVQAEKEVANKGEVEEAELAETPAPPAGAAGQPGPTAPPPQPQPSPLSKLWIPGRG